MQVHQAGKAVGSFFTFDSLLFQQATQVVPHKARVIDDQCTHLFPSARFPFLLSLTSLLSVESSQAAAPASRKGSSRSGSSITSKPSFNL
jgi:hypothetical protein